MEGDVGLIDLLRLHMHKGSRDEKLGKLCTSLVSESYRLKREYEETSKDLAEKKQRLSDLSGHIRFFEDSLKLKSATISALDVLVKLLEKTMLPPPGNGRAAPDTSADNPDGPTAGSLTAPVAAPVADL